MLQQLSREFEKLPGAKVQDCGFDRCIDVPVPFALNQWEISDQNYKREIAEACERYKRVLRKLPNAQREIQ
jgi:hypothetical protein